MPEKTQRSKDVSKSVSQSCKLRMTRVVFTLSKRDAFRVSGEFKVLYCNVLIIPQYRHRDNKRKRYTTATTAV